MLRKIILFCLLSAALLALTFSLSTFWFLAWFGFVPLFFAVENKPKVTRFLLAYLTGVLFWAGTIYWLVHVTLLGTIILVLYLALYFGIFGLAFPYLLSTNYYLLSIPSAWVLLEYIRSYLFTGFPWALLGYSQYNVLPAIQIADITGVWGVSFLVMMVNVFVYQVIGNRSWVIGGGIEKEGKKPGILLPVLLVVFCLGYGFLRLYLPPTTYHLSPAIKVSVIQGNIPQELKWEPKAMGYILNKYTRLTEEAAKAGPDLIVWPEAASPGLLGEDEWVFENIYSLAKKVGLPLLLGAVMREKDIYFNSALLVDKNGQIAGRYDKIHLVPFGEYIPLKEFFPFLETVVPIGDINAGKDYTIFQIGNRKPETGNRFAVLICFEDLFPELSREFVKRGARFLVNITNDAWYKKSTAPYQHLQASVFRAVENRVPLVRAANTGISGFIAPTGKIISLVGDQAKRNIFVDGFDTRQISLSKGGTGFYTRLGDAFIPVCLIFILYGIILQFKKKR
jgi:apolipoprotein N-acyltransferase